MKLRPYQVDAVDAIVAAKARGVKRALYCLPTGTGKTQIFVGVQSRLAVPALVLAHREELLEQAAARFRQADPSVHVGIEQGARTAPGWSGIIAASVQTVCRGRRLEWFKPGLIIVDEAHHAVARSYVKALDRFNAFADDGPLVVGCTATPKRLDRLNLQSVFQEQVYSYTIRDAIRDGWLCDIRGFRVKTTTDLTGIKRTAGDYNQGQLQDAVDVDVRTDDTIRHWEQVAADRPTIVFCAGVKHAKNAAAAWSEKGYPAEHIHGGMGSEERRAVLDRFRSGETQVLTNVEVLTEGFDYPEIGCVVMMRPTQSWALYVQCVGRGMRLAPGKRDVVVIDVVDNCGRHTLASVPAILDLPPSLDLEGHTLAQAAAKVAEIVDSGAGFAELMDKRQPRTFHDLNTILETVDLLADVSMKEEWIEAGCKLRWNRLTNNLLLCILFTGGVKREARLTRDQLGKWTLTLLEAGRVVAQGVCPLRPDADEAAVLALSDARVRRQWPEAEWSGGHEAVWRSREATERQVAALVRFGIDRGVARSLTRDRASALLDRFFHTKRSRQPAGARR